LFLPQSYVSGTPIANGTTTWLNPTLADLGITPGTYQWDLPNDTITLTTVPEPSSEGAA